MEDTSEELKEQPLAIAHESEKSKIGRIVRQSLGYIIALVCLVWVFHDIHPERLLRQLSEISWGWIMLGLIFDFLAYLSQGYRWHLLLGPIGNISPVKTTQAIYSGIFANEILPFRTGELVRAYLVSRWMNARFVNVIPSIMVERFFDAIWLGIGIGLTAFLVDLPRNLVDAAKILGVIVIGFIAIFIFLVMRRERQLEHKELSYSSHRRIFSFLGSILNRLAAGVKTIGTSRSFYFGLLVSPLFLILQIISFWLIMKGYGLHINLWAASAVMMILMLGTAIPNAPSNVGTYQFFIVVGLTLFDIDKTTATGFSVVAFIVLTIPLLLIGAFALMRTGMRLKTIRSEISRIIKK